ncbi:hypothetical protein JW698_02150 [Candidatus Wolfebacteria bacterium]|nr:hypothetical protein [Candidatus Wolfebacteria bacterium]
MKKSIYLFLLLVGLYLTANIVFAQEAIVEQNINEIVSKEITIEDLKVENTGILPSSPFYFLKDWGRAIKKTLTLDSVKKAELELQYINEKAAEIKKLEEIAPNNIKALNKAVINYQENAEKLKENLESLKETSQDSKVYKFLDDLVDRSLQHQQLFDELQLKFEENTEFKNILRSGQEKMSEVMAKIPEKFEDIDVFTRRLENRIENVDDGVFKELRAVEIVEKIKEKIPKEEQEKIQELQDKLIEKFEDKFEILNEADKIKTFSRETLENLAGDQIQRVKILEQLKNNSILEIKEKIGEAQEFILENQSQKLEINRDDVEKLILEAKNFISQAEDLLKNAITTNTTSFTEQSIEKAEFYLSETKKLLNENNIKEAFSRASLAVAVAKNALRQPQTRIQTEIREKNEIMEKEEKINIDNSQIKAKNEIQERNQFCIQVITPAISPEGICKEFSSPCDVPLDWKTVDNCSASQTPFLDAVNSFNKIDSINIIDSVQKLTPNNKVEILPEKNTQTIINQ